MINVLRTTSGPCDTYSDSVSLTSEFAFGIDGNWNIEFAVNVSADSDDLLIQVNKGAALYAYAVYPIGADIVNDTPTEESGWTTLIQPYLTGDSVGGVGGSPLILSSGTVNGTFSKKLWAEQTGNTFVNADTLTFIVKSISVSGTCEGLGSTALLNIREYNGSSGNPNKLEMREGSTRLYRANSGPTLVYLEVGGPNQGFSKEVEIDFSSIVLPAGVTGSVTNVDLMRSVQLSDVNSTNGEPDFFIQCLLEGLESGGNSIQNAILVCYCEFDGTKYIPTLSFWNANTNSRRQIEKTNRIINGRDVLLVGSGARGLYWNGTEWQFFFFSGNHTDDALFSDDGSRFYFCSSQSSIAKRTFTGTTDAQYIVNSNWSATSVAAGQLNNFVANTGVGTSGSSIGLGAITGLCRIGYDGVLGATSGTLMMIAALDATNESIVFLQEQSGTDDLIQINIEGTSVLNLSGTSLVELRGFEFYNGSVPTLFFGDGENSILRAEIIAGQGIIVSYTELSTSSYGVDGLTHRF